MPLTTGQGRLPLRSSWGGSYTNLYKPIIPGSTDVVALAIKDFVLGRKTELELRHWDGTQWFYPTMYQKLVDPVADRWPNTVPNILSDAVNEMAANRPWIEPPVGGNLTGGRALVATGNGLEVEEKLVEFQDPTMVRYVGEEPGDYATFEEAIASLPTGANDLSSSSKYYVIYFRELVAVHRYLAGAITINVHSLHLCGLPESDKNKKISLTPLDDTSLNATFGLKHAYTGGVSQPRLTFTNMQLGTTMNYGIPLTSGSEFNSLEIEINGTGLILTFNTSDFYFRITPVAISTIPKAFRAIYVKCAPTSTLYFITTGMNKFTYYRNAGTITNDLGTYNFYDSQGYTHLLGGAYNEYNLKTTICRNTLSAISGVGWGALTFFTIKRNSTSSAYWFTLDDFVCYSEYTWVSNVVNRSGPLTFFNIEDVAQVKCQLNKLELIIASTTLGNLIDISNLTVVKTGLTSGFNSFAYITFNDVSVKSAFGCTIFGKAYLLQCVNGAVNITNSALAGLTVKSLGSAIVTMAGSPNSNQLTAGNITRDEAQLFATASRTTGKQFIAQQPLPPASPQPGDLWIETTEQF